MKTVYRGEGRRALELAAAAASAAPRKSAESEATEMNVNPCW